MNYEAGLIALACAILPSVGSAQTLSIERDTTSNSDCHVSYDMATAAFNATDAQLYWPIAAPDAHVATVALGRKAFDISGGDGLAVDSAVFTALPKPDNERIGTAIFWQRQPKGGKRVVVVETPHSWQGSRYTLFAVNAALAQEDFIDQHRAARRDGFSQNEASDLVPVLGERWQPPLIMRDSGSEALWFIDMGEPYLPLSNWTVYILGDAGFMAACEIDFKPNDIAGLAALPIATRRFAALLDEALGPSQNDGTLRPTARIRVAVRRNWTTLSARPWALTTLPYNSREEVNEALVNWAKVNASRADLLDQLIAAYDPAERALAAYYSETFELETDEASAFAAYATDHMFRRHFVFPSENRALRQPEVSPWPDIVRNRNALR